MNTRSISKSRRSQKKQTKSKRTPPPTQLPPPPKIIPPIHPPLKDNTYRHSIQWVDTVINKSPNQPYTSYKDTFTPINFDGITLNPLHLNPYRNVPIFNNDTLYTVGGKKKIYKTRKAKKLKKNLTKKIKNTNIRKENKL